jgi:hypothetical protein
MFQGFSDRSTVKVKVNLLQATKTQRRSRGMDLLFLNLGARWEWVVNTTPRPLYPGEWLGTHGIGGSEGHSGRAMLISLQPEFDPRTVQPVARCYTDWATPASDGSNLTYLSAARNIAYTFLSLNGRNYVIKSCQHEACTLSHTFYGECGKEITPLNTAAMPLQQNPRSLISAFTVSKKTAMQLNGTFLWSELRSFTHCLAPKEGVY